VIGLLQRPLPDNTQHSKQTATVQAGFEPEIPANERPQTARTYKLGCFLQIFITAKQISSIQDNYLFHYTDTVTSLVNVNRE